MVTLEDSLEPAAPDPSAPEYTVPAQLMGEGGCTPWEIPAEAGNTLEVPGLGPKWFCIEHRPEAGWYGGRLGMYPGGQEASFWPLACCIWVTG